mmetsp:Transcript_8064/g.27702  ORF Transcript_8064/g.27702 Transcript_8064/m.27702 type:complete len:238 (+) Transcript_8064:320-1033(+)
METKMASSALIVLVPWLGHVFSHRSNSCSHPPSLDLSLGSQAYARSSPSTAPKQTRRLENSGREQSGRVGSKTSPLSLVPILRSYSLSPPSSASLSVLASLTLYPQKDPFLRLGSLESTTLPRYHSPPPPPSPAAASSPALGNPLSFILTVTLSPTLRALWTFAGLSSPTFTSEWSGSASAPLVLAATRSTTPSLYLVHSVDLGWCGAFSGGSRPTCLRCGCCAMSERLRYWGVSMY